MRKGCFYNKFVKKMKIAFSRPSSITADHKYSHITYNFPTGVESEVPEFAQLCGLILSPKWEYVCAGFSLAAVFGVCIVYWILMSNFLENTIEFGQGNRLLLEMNVTKVLSIFYY